MITLLSLATFAAFVFCWMLALAYNKVQALISSPRQAEATTLAHSKIDQLFRQKKEEHQQKVINKLIKQNKIKDNKLSPVSSKPEAVQDILVVPEVSPQIDLTANVSANELTNELNIAMIQQRSRNLEQEKSSQNEPLAEDKNANILKQLTTAEILDQALEQQILETVQPIASQQPEQRQRREQKSELQIIQALNSHKKPQKQQPQQEIVAEVDRKKSDADPVTTQLMQQIDNLFENDPEGFMAILSKYRIQETRYSDDKILHGEEGNKDVVLEEQLKQVQQELQTLRKQVTKFYTQNRQLQKNVQDKQQRIRNMSSQIQQSHKIISALQGRLQQVQQSQQQVSHSQDQNYQQLRTQNEGLKGTIAEKDQIISTQQQQIDKLDKQMRNYKQSSRTRKEEVKRLESELATEKERHITISAQMIEKQELIKKLSSDLSRLQSGATNAQQLQELKSLNQNLRCELQFAQTHIKLTEQAEKANLERIAQLQRQLQGTGQPLTANSDQVHQLKSKIAKMQPVVSNYQALQKQHLELKVKLDKLQHETTTLRLQTSRNNPKQRSFHTPRLATSPTSRLPTQESPASKPNPKLGFSRFLPECTYLSLYQRQFLFSVLNQQLRGVAKTDRLYHSVLNRSVNPHQLIDNIPNILLIVTLQNGHIIGAYSQHPFAPGSTLCPASNLAFLFDVTHRRSFACSSGQHSIAYNQGSLVWGHSELRLKHEQPEIVYSNFGKTHNVYWDGKCSIGEFLGEDKQWARISHYEIFKIVTL